ncbi:MAG: NAD-dependent epimerase/dehydratase family protein [Elusimicrobiota bacterium]
MKNTGKILITGANGFIGSHLAGLMVERDSRVYCMVRESSNLRWLEKLDVEYVYADLLKPDSLKKAVEGVDEIYHLAGAVRAVYNSKLYKINYRGTKNLVEAAKKYNSRVKKFTYVSSQSAWGPKNRGPVSHYGKSKKKAEDCVKNLKNFAIVRPAAVYGPRDRDFLSLFRTAEYGFFIKPLQAGKLNFIHVKDCTRGIADSPAGKEIFLSDGKNYSWDEVKKTFEKTVGRKIVTLVLPRKFVEAIGHLGSMTGKITGTPLSLNKDKVKEILAGDWVVPKSPVNVEFPLEEGFKNTYKWYKDKGWL